MDRSGRQRPVKQAYRMPVLVAQGVWPASGRQEVIAWVLGRAEDEASWEALLTQAWERGIWPERGLCLLVGDGAASRPRLLSEDTSGLLASFVPIARWSANSALVADA